MTSKNRSRSHPPIAFDIKEHIVSEQQAWDFLVGRGSHPKDRIIRVGDLRIGGKKPVVIAGPCSVDGKDLFFNTIESLIKEKISLIRANIFKFRTLSKSFQGLHEKGLDILREAKDRYKIHFVIEILDTRHLDLLLPVADVFQVGSRSMANTALLKALGRVNKPILLKRMYAANLGEYLAAADYVAQGGNQNIILCERGIRSFEPWTRFLLDVPGIALLRKVSPLPVIADISHSLGRTDVAIPLARAALAAGANGLMVEVHCCPNRAKSDAHQQLTPDEFSHLLKSLKMSSGKKKTG